jgi:aldose 1-epimerase
MKPGVQRSSFGKLPDGTETSLFTLANSHGLIAKVTDYGTIITELHVPDRNGKLKDVVLGFDNLEQYLKGHPYFGCTVGRVANRIANGRFTLDGKEYRLAVNNGPNHLHGGLKGFDKVVWKTETPGGAAVKFSYTSPDGEEGYPGEVQTTVTIALTDENELRIDYLAVTNQATPVNLTNHSYFNLAGEGDILAQELMLAADAYTPSDPTSIPTGEIRAVRGTPMDFTRSTAIGARFSQLPGSPVGYDNNYVLNGGGKSLALAARAYDARSGRVMELRTTHPGVQLYTANYLDGTLKGKGGWIYQPYAGFCLETQHFPDSVNKPNFPTTILRPGQAYRQTTTHKFSVQ